MTRQAATGPGHRDVVPFRPPLPGTCRRHQHGTVAHTPVLPEGDLRPGAGDRRQHGDRGP